MIRDLREKLDVSNDQMGAFTREMLTIKKNRVKIIEIKNTI